MMAGHDDDDGKSDDKTLLGYEFVGMMFAVTVGEIGLHAAELAKENLWEEGKIWEAMPAISHLVLSAVLVAASWVGWSRTRSPGGAADVKDVLSWRFVVLLLDVLLVVFYFILVKTVESHEVNGKLEFSADADHEAFWLIVIFALYFIWDVITKGVIAAPDDDRKLLRRCFGSACWRRAWVSAVCVAIAFGCYLAFEGAQGVNSVLVADIGLLCLVLLFRALKDVATANAPRGAKEPDHKYHERIAGSNRATWWSVGLGSGMALCLLLVARGVTGP